MKKDEKLVIISGGTRGIGAEISKTLQKSGYTVVATYASNHVAAEGFSKQYGVRVIRADVRNHSECIQVMNQVGRPFALIHNAGITDDAFFHKMKEDQWNRVISTNLSSCFNFIHPFIKDMRDAQEGKIIIISSVNGLKGQIGQTNYSAAKAGIIGFTKALALESAAKNITVNAIAPGYVETEMTKSIDPDIVEHIKNQIPAKRFAQPSEVANCVKYLLSEEAGYITGETININGGLYMS